MRERIEQEVERRLKGIHVYEFVGLSHLWHGISLSICNR